MHIRISLPAQTLALHDAYGDLLVRYRVSTARNGAGEVSGSYRTPRGRHRIRAKIGAGAPVNTVFVRRRPTGEIWSPALAEASPGRDWILTRILWLCGNEPGFNRLGPVDTMRRYIYIHGSPDTAEMGVPGSIGCVRMHNGDIIDLFDRVPPYVAVDIVDYALSVGDWATQGPRVGALREAVFVAEQKVPAEMEYDAWDPQSRHAAVVDSAGQVIGTGRLLPDGHIGRMAVAAGARGRGIGRAVLEALLEEARQRGMGTLVLSAQTHAVGFYERFGFAVAGPEYEEAGIAHRQMRRSIA